MPGYWNATVMLKYQMGFYYYLLLAVAAHLKESSVNAVGVPVPDNPHSYKFYNISMFSYTQMHMFFRIPGRRDHLHKPLPLEAPYEIRFKPVVTTTIPGGRKK